MTLVDPTQLQELYDAVVEIGSPQLMSGGSAANTAVGFAALGGKAAFVGRVNADDFGVAFCRDIREAGVKYAANPAVDGAPTASSIILVTPDAARTMNTCLGASIELQPEDIDWSIASASGVIYLEGYLFDAPAGPAIFGRAAEVAAQNNTRIALSLSDSLCVNRHRRAFWEFVKDHVDILFANEAEAISLAEFDHPECVKKLADIVDEVVVTCGAKGAIISHVGQQHLIDAMPQGPVVDTTGAGDLFAAGYLFGRTKNFGVPQSGQIASLLAGEVISHIGARSKEDLKALVKPVTG